MPIKRGEPQIPFLLAARLSQLEHTPVHGTEFTLAVIIVGNWVQRSTIGLCQGNLWGAVRRSHGERLSQSAPPRPTPRCHGRSR
jgi:hypothetical protein